MPGFAEQLRSAPCYEDLNFSPEDRKEIERQKSLLRNTFTNPLYTGNPRNMTIVAELRGLVKKICEGEGTVEEFLAYQSENYENPEYAFLAQPHPGLNVSGWGVLLAELDPLKYGSAIKRMFETGTSGKIRYG